MGSHQLLFISLNKSHAFIIPPPPPQITDTLSFDRQRSHLHSSYSAIHSSSAFPLDHRHYRFPSISGDAASFNQQRSRLHTQQTIPSPPFPSDHRQLLWYFQQSVQNFMAIQMIPHMIYFLCYLCLKRVYNYSVVFLISCHHFFHSDPFPYEM